MEQKQEKMKSKERPTVHCNSCDALMDVNENFQEVEIEGYVLGALQCPECKLVFPSYMIDDEVRLGQKRLQKVVEDIREIIDTSKKRLLFPKEERKYRGLLKKYEKVKEDNRGLSQALIAKYGSLFETIGEVYKQ